MRGEGYHHEWNKKGRYTQKHSIIQIESTETSAYHMCLLTGLNMFNNRFNSRRFDTIATFYPPRFTYRMQDNVHFL